MKNTSEWAKMNTPGIPGTLVDKSLEEAAIGTMLSKPDLVEFSLFELSEWDFVDQVNRYIFQACKESQSDGLIDSQAILATLAAKGQLKNGAAERVAGLLVGLDFIPSKEHAAKLKILTGKRMWIST